VGKLSDFAAGQPGYFRENAEEDFPWNSTDKSVWYSLLVVEDGRIQRYGFTSSKSNKAGLRNALETLTNEEALLLGVWTGQYSTHLFVLNIQTAIKKLKS
jgi:dipeptidyl aminopeptidase/acylaminoacyl peptidase